MDMSQNQINADYTNEIITALEGQRNMALKQAAEAQAREALIARRLAAIVQVIKDKKLEKFFEPDKPDKPVPQSKEKAPKRSSNAVVEDENK